MEDAGAAVADVAKQYASDCDRIHVLCGPGNNGGDGFVAARLLQADGYDVSVSLLGTTDSLHGDAAHMAGLWTGSVECLTPALLQSVTFVKADVFVDAIFGAGLARTINDDIAAVIDALNAHAAPIVSVDVPSGLNGTSGEVDPHTVSASATVTFFRKKPGHLLYPGRRFCGIMTVADIGIHAAVLEEIDSALYANTPPLWRDDFPTLGDVDHKYSRGHAVVVSGPTSKAGAARLSARGALRVGAGLVTMASPRSAVLVNASHVTAIMLEGFDPPEGLRDVLEDPRRNAIVLGPGCGVGETTRAMVKTCLESTAAVVLDADALTSFESKPAELFAMISARLHPVVLTPHTGEFDRLFGPPENIDPQPNKLQRACEAARKSGATIVLKGADTVIAMPDGSAAINENGTSWLATAGSGDVLAGFIGGLLAQGMPAWQASCAGVWLHAESGRVVGPGLISEDLPDALVQVLGQHVPGGFSV